ncbi:MAG: trypsin-like peptidase domain-containing protein, partial [Alphaproteobacteria bacterium]|nr:trypsin-like peptidase domain-containing protein [Alphaproteobacteria bacterium]
MRILPIATLACALVASPSAPLQALPAGTLESVVSVLPVWLGRPQGGAGGRPGAAPEGSGVVLRPGLVVTAWHVVKPARRIDIRLSDGRLLPAQLAAKDAASDIALLRVDASLPPIEIAPAPQL